MVAAFVLAGALQQVPNFKTSISVGFTPVSVAAGATTTATATIMLPDDYHAYQNPPKSKFENPLTLKAGKTPLKVTNFVYPKGVAKKLSGTETLIYEGNVRVTFKVTVPKGTKPGVVKVPMIVQYQLCNDSTCLPPRDMNVNLAVTVKAS